MTFAISWLVSPAVLAVLALGCGLFLERASGFELPRPLLLPAGFVVLSIATQFAHMSDVIAELGTPFVIALAIVGLGLGLPLRWPRGATEQRGGGGPDASLCDFTPLLQFESTPLGLERGHRQQFRRLVRRFDGSGVARPQIASPDHASFHVRLRPSTACACAYDSSGAG